MPLALFLLALPYRLAQVWFRPQQVIVHNIERHDGARKRRIVDAGPADTPYTPTSSSRARAREHLSRQGRGRVETLGDKLRRRDRAPATPPTPIVIESPQPEADLSEVDNSWDITFNSASFICSTLPYPPTSSSPCDPPDDPDGCSDLANDTPIKPIEEVIKASPADVAAREIVGSPQARASAIKRASTRRHFSPRLPTLETLQRETEAFRANWGRKPPKHTLHRQAPLYPHGISKRSPFPFQKVQAERLKMSGPQAVKVGPSLSRGIAPAPKKLVPHLFLDSEGLTRSRFNPSVILPQFSSDPYGASRIGVNPLEWQQLLSNQCPQQQQYAPEPQYMPSAFLTVTETVHQEISHLGDAPEVVCGEDGSAVSESDQAPAHELQAPATNTSSLSPKRAAQLASHAAAKTYYEDEKTISKIDAHLEQLATLRKSGSGDGPPGNPDLNRAATHSATQVSSTTPNDAKDRIAPSHQAANQPPSTGDGAAPSDTSANGTTVTSTADLPTYVVTPSQLSTPHEAGKPKVDSRSTEEEACNEADISADISSDYFSKLSLNDHGPRLIAEDVVPPSMSDEQKSLIKQFNQNELNEDGEFDSLFDSAVDAVKALVTPLSDAEQATLDATVASTDYGRNKKIALPNPRLKVEDFGTILPESFSGSPSAWLNDEIVNEYLRILTKALKDRDVPVQKQKANAGWTPRVHAFTSFWFTTPNAAGWAKRAGLEGRRYLDCELVLYPVCHNNHWRLIAVKPKERTIEYLDSMSSTINLTITGKMLEHLEQVLGKEGAWNREEWTIVKHQRSTQQLNGSDCGVFVLLNSLALLRGVEISDVIACNGMMDARKRIVTTIFNQAQTTEFD